MRDDDVVTRLLEQAESELADIRKQRADLERTERIAAEKVAHLRALTELSAERGPQLPTQTAEPDKRVENIAAEILQDRGEMHYRDLYLECERRGGVIVSSNPAAVLLTRRPSLL